MSKEQMTDSQIVSLVEKASAGDDGAMAQLIAVIMPFAKAKAVRHKTDSSRIPEEDLIQEGMIGFLSAVKSFDSSKGVPFVAFANLCIERRILSVLRSYSSDGNRLLTNAVSIDENDGTGGDPIKNVDSAIEVERIISVVNSSFSKLEKDVFTCRLTGLDRAEIAAKLGCSERAVDNALQRVKRKLRPKIK